MSHRLPLRALVAAITLCGTAAQAQNAQPVTSLNRIVEQTLLTNPEIQTRYQDFRASLEGQSVARGGFLPQVNAQGSYGREYRSNVPDAGSYSWTRPGYSLELRQLLFDGFRTSNDVKQLGFTKLARYYDLMAVTDETAYAAIQSYADLQRNRELEELAKHNFDLHRDTMAQIRERAMSGVGRYVDLEQASGRLALAQTNLFTESANVLDVTQRYRRITGASPTADMLPIPDMSNRLPDHPKDFSDSIRRNPSFLSTQASVQAANAGIKVAQSNYSPKLEVVATTGRDQSEADPAYRNVQSSSVQLVASMNLYRGGADAARVRQTSAQAYAARDLRNYTCRNIQQDLAVAWTNITRLREQMPFLVRHEQSTNKVRDAYRQQFNIGQRSLLDLLDTENELFESRRALVNGRYDLRLAEYRWLTLSHRLLSALELIPARDDVPDEERLLESDANIIEMCATDAPDQASLQPVKVEYNEGVLPPTLTPLYPTSGASPAAATTTGMPAAASAPRYTPVRAAPVAPEDRAAVRPIYPAGMPAATPARQP